MHGVHEGPQVALHAGGGPRPGGEVSPLCRLGRCRVEGSMHVQPLRRRVQAAVQTAACGPRSGCRRGPTPAATLRRVHCWLACVLPSTTVLCLQPGEPQCGDHSQRSSVSCYGVPPAWRRAAALPRMLPWQCAGAVLPLQAAHLQLPGAGNESRCGRQPQVGAAGGSSLGATEVAMLAPLPTCAAATLPSSLPDATMLSAATALGPSRATHTHTHARTHTRAHTHTHTCTHAGT